MKQLILLFAFCLSISLFGQEAIPAKSGKLCTVLHKFSVTATAGTNTLSTNELSFKNLSNVSLGELGISFRMNPRLKFGISTMSGLSSKNSGYYDAEGQFFSFCTEDEDEEGDDDEDGEDEDDDDEGCDEDDFGENLMGTVTFTLSDRLPFFIQAAGGYSFSGNAPAYSTMIGYNQKIVSGLGLLAGVRFSDVLYKKPAEAVKVRKLSGFKLELGLSWNF